jgi:HAD superfamily hydrolase (TIGR01509 family)
MSQLRALIFDVDGTLADTERDGHRVAFNRAFEEAGLDWDWSVELYGELLSVAGGKERIRFYQKQYCPDVPLLDDAVVAELHAIKTKHYRDLLAEGAIPLRPGVKRLIAEARDRELRLAIATTSALPNVIALLERTLDPSWFEAIAAGDVVPAKKPAPDIYHYLLKQMNLEASECLVVEDSHHGLIAANGADLPTIVTFNNYTEGQDFSLARLVVNHLGEPELPCRVVSGNALDVNYVELETLNHLHSSN